MITLGYHLSPTTLWNQQHTLPTFTAALWVQHSSASSVCIYECFSTYLYSHHRKDLNWDPVKLIKTAPGSRLGKAFVNIPTRLKDTKIKQDDKITAVTLGTESTPKRKKKKRFLFSFPVCLFLAVYSLLWVFRKVHGSSRHNSIIIFIAPRCLPLDLLIALSWSIRALVWFKGHLCWITYGSASWESP